MEWNAMPEKIKNRYNWKNGVLSLGKTDLSNYFIKVQMLLKNPEQTKEYFKVLYIVGEEEKKYEGIIDLSNFIKEELPFPLCNECIDYKRTSRNELLNIAKDQRSLIIAQGWYINTIGWQAINENWFYCAGERLFNPRNVNNIIVDSKLKEGYKIRCENSKNRVDTIEEIKKLICLGNTPLNICLLYLTMGLLRTLFSYADVPPKFLLYIFGDTGKYKTTLAKYFFDIYSSGRGNSFACADLTSSESALWRKISDFKDCVFILDDLSPGINARETSRKEGTVNDFIRTVANCEERNIKSGNRLQGDSVGCVIAITAEYMIKTESIVNRTLILDLNKHSLNNVLNFISKNPLLINSYVCHFLNWSCDNDSRIIQYIQDEWKIYRDTIYNNEISPRVRDSIKMLEISSRFLNLFLKSSNGDMTGVMSFIHHSLSEVAKDEENMLRGIRSYNQSYDIAEEIVKLLNSGTIQLTNSVFKGGNPPAYIYNGYLYIQPSYLLECLESVITNIKLTKNMISAYLIKKHILNKDNSASTKKGKGGSRYYLINLEQLADEARIEIEI